MKKILLLSVLLSQSVFADDIQVIARAYDTRGRQGHNIRVETFHSAYIKNTSGTRKDYRFTWCAFVENTDNVRQCFYEKITLKHGEVYRDHYSAGKFFVDVKRGTYKIIAESMVGDQKVEGYATLTVV